MDLAPEGGRQRERTDVFAVSRGLGSSGVWLSPHRRFTLGPTSIPVLQVMGRVTCLQSRNTCPQEGHSRGLSRWPRYASHDGQRQLTRLKPKKPRTTATTTT